MAFDPSRVPVTLSRRRFVAGALILGLPGARAATRDGSLAGRYGARTGEAFPVPAIDLSRIRTAFLRREVIDPTGEAPGTIVVDPARRFLFFVEPGGRALRYGVGVGREGFAWAGSAVIKSKQIWPDWYPPKEMLARQPVLMRAMRRLPGGLGMPGGPANPLGARALYLWQGDHDTLYRIHGTVEPWSIGHNVSSGCIRMLNQDVMDLYERVVPGAPVIVLPANAPTLAGRERWEALSSARPQSSGPMITIERGFY